MELRALVGAVRKRLLQKQEFSEHRAQDESDAVAILNFSRVNKRMKQQAYCIDENMLLLTLDFLSGVIAVWINAKPHFSALFTLQLSMMAALGLASRPAASRHDTSSA